MLKNPEASITSIKRNNDKVDANITSKTKKDEKVEK